jgi:hypothetical protein
MPHPPSTPSSPFVPLPDLVIRSKMVLLEEPAAQAKRFLKQRRADKVEWAAKSISRISLDVDKLATKARKGCGCICGGDEGGASCDGAKNGGGVAASSKIFVSWGGEGMASWGR